MIQRIQTVWFLLAAICVILSSRYSFYTGNVIDNVTKTKIFTQLNADSFKIFSFVQGCLEAGILGAIFMYKLRTRQLLLSLVLTLVAIINIVIFIYKIGSFVEGQYAITSIITFLIPVFLLLAARGIWKDEQLVKSADRLR